MGVEFNVEFDHLASGEVLWHYNFFLEVYSVDSLPEFVGTLHIYLGPYRGNPIALYLRQEANSYQISPQMYPWNRTVGVGENPNKAAADFEEKWKKNGLSTDMYTGPHWEGGIKPEKPKPAPPPKPATPPPKPEAKTETASPTPPQAPQPSDADKPAEPPSETDQKVNA